MYSFLLYFVEKFLQVNSIDSDQTPNDLRGLRLPWKSVVRLTDRPDMILVISWVENEKSYVHI